MSLWEVVPLESSPPNLAARRLPPQRDPVPIVTNSARPAGPGFKQVWVPDLRGPVLNPDSPLIATNFFMTVPADEVFPFGVDVEPP